MSAETTGTAHAPGHQSLAILLTPPQPAGIAVVRLVGAAVIEFTSHHLTKAPRAGRCVYCDLRDGSDVIDDIVAVCVSDLCIDLNLHGGEWIIEATLRLAERCGFHIADWHEAAALACDGESEMEAEVAVALPHAGTREALALLLAQPAAWAAMLAGDDLNQRLWAIDDPLIQYILHPPTIAIVGQPNAGKSTLINRLAGQARSIVADVPGTTRDYVTTRANLGGLIVELIDTPGMRETDDPIEAEAIAQAMSVIHSADIVIELRDVTQQARPLKIDRQSLLVWNKCDEQTPPSALGIPISAATGEGMLSLRDEVFSALAIADGFVIRARCWTPRQRAILLALGTACLE